MEKRNTSKWIGSVEDEIDEVEEISVQVKQEPPASIWLQSQYPGTVIVIGSVSGNRYVFNGGGSTVEVDARDAPKMLEKVFGGNSCCGSGVVPTHHFVAL
jgi:hypothetical protein